MRFAGMAVCAMAVAACEATTDLAECPAMPIHGWAELPRTPAFAALSHKQEQRFDPIAEMSHVLWADSNYSYERLLTFDVAHPRFAAGAAAERCIRTVSFMAAIPLEGARGASVASFLEFLAAHGASGDAVKAVEAARERNSGFARVSVLKGAPVSAGIVTQGARGSFFRVEVGSAP